jgi:hypothetical protein
MSESKAAYIKRIANLCAKQVIKELSGASLKAELCEGWDFHISKPLALFLLHSNIVDDNKNGCIMSKEYGQDNNEEEDMWNGVVNEDLDTLYGEEYENFAISR